MKKFMLFCFSLVVCFIMFCGFNTKAADVTLSMVNAASVRTDGTYQGLKFQATFSSNYVGTKEYGFYIALGNNSRSDMVNAIKAGTNVNGHKIVKSYKTGEERTFAVTIYDIPSTNYVDDITAIAYFNDAGKEVFTDICVTRSIANVAMSALNSGESAAILNDVSSYLAANYMVITDGLNQFNEFTVTPFVNTKPSFSDLSTLYEEFINDINDACGTSLTTSCTISDFYNTLKEGVGDSDYTIDADDNIAKVFSGARLVKWKWLLDYFKNVDTNNYAKQADALMRADRTCAVQLYSMSNLIYSLWNFLKTDTQERGPSYPPKKYSNESSYNDVNWGLYSSYTNSTCAEIGSKVNLPSAPSKNGYSFVKYTDGVNDYNPNDEITISSSALSIKSVFNLVDYTITYNLNSGTNSGSNVSSYNVESDTITLYNATRDGYIFGGWYYESDFSGSVVTSIPHGSYGNKVLYAKWNEPAPTNYDVSSSDVSVLNAITPNIIVDDSIDPGRYYLNGTGLASSYTSRYYTSNVNAFTDIQSALSHATANDVIYVFSGTYNDALTISTNGISIIGPNYNIKGNESRNTEAVVNNTITVTADDVTLRGIKLTGTNNYITWTTEIDSLTVQNLRSEATGGFGTKINSGTYYGIVASTSPINGLNIVGSYIYNETGARKGAVLITGLVTGLNILDSSLTNGGSASSEAIRIPSIAGAMNIKGNSIVWDTTNMTIYIGYTANTCTQINVCNNIVKGNASTTQNCTIRNIPSTTTINIIGNYFDSFNASNNTLSIHGVSGAQASIKYNYFASGVTYKCVPTNVTVTYENNYYAADRETTTEEHPLASLEALRTAYMASNEYTAYGSHCVY